jgi:hypothetical protein
MLGFISALSLLVGGAQPCQAALPHGPPVPAPIVFKTDCGSFRLATDGEVTRLPGNWLATHTSPSQPHYTIRRTRPGRYLVVSDGKVAWRSRGVYRNEAGNWAFGEHSFAFDSWGRRALFLTDLRGPERLVFRGRNTSPIGFSRTGQLLVARRRTITVLALDGTILRTIHYRPSSSYTFDEATKTLYFVTLDGMLSAAEGSRVRSIGRTRVRGWMSLLGQRLVTFTTQRHLAIVRRSDGSLVAGASWRGAKREIDSEVAVSDDGRLFAFRLARPGKASVYFLRAGENRARLAYSHSYRLSGCGSSVRLAGNGSSFLYYYSDGWSGVPKPMVITGEGAMTMLARLQRALPRKYFMGEESAYWEADFLN